LSPREIEIEEFIELGPDTVELIDVREDDEFVQGRVPGARHFRLATIPDRVDEIPRDQAIYLICAVGGRSMKAAEFLDAEGFETINVAGGTKAWIAADQPVESGTPSS
jgi:rhodanese-related sulfurtransferase